MPTDDVIRVSNTIDRMGINPHFRAHVVRIKEWLHDEPKSRELVSGVRGEQVVAAMSSEKVCAVADCIIRRFLGLPLANLGYLDTIKEVYVTDKQDTTTTATVPADTKAAADKAKADKAAEKKVAAEKKAAEKKAAADKKAADKAAKKAAGDKSGAVSKAGDGKGPGIIDTIAECILSPKGATIAEIMAVLKTRFPDRGEDGMTATAKIQVNRLKSSRGYTIDAMKDEARGGVVYTAKAPPAKAAVAPAE